MKRNTIEIVFYALLLKPSNCKKIEIYNIGCDEGMEYSVKDVASLLIQKIKGENVCVDKWIDYIEDRPFNDKRYYISNHKLKNLGWDISINFKEGIKQLISSK